MRTRFAFLILMLVLSPRPSFAATPGVCAKILGSPNSAREFEGERLSNLFSLLRKTPGVTAKTLSADEVSWSERPSDFDVFAPFSDPNILKVLSPGDRGVILRYDDFLARAYKSSRRSPKGHRGDDVLPNAKIHEKILEVSRENQGREVGIARFLSANGTEILHGSPHVGTEQEIPLREAMAAIPPQPQGASYLEYIHNHPFYDIDFYRQAGDVYSLRSGLSGVPDSLEKSGDHGAAIRMSLAHVGVYVRMIAVMPNGYFYRRTYLDGHLVRDPVQWPAIN